MNQSKYLFVLVIISVISAFFIYQLNSERKINTKKNITKTSKPKVLDNDALFYSVEYNHLKIYSEKIIRGDGVISFELNDSLQIYNLNGSLYGEINCTKKIVKSSVKESSYVEKQYTLDIPKPIIARQINPSIEYDLFEFDALKPDPQEDFYYIFLNQELKKVKRLEVNNYYFETWSEYIKSAFLEILPEMENMTSNERKYWYNMVSLRGDSLLIVSVPPSSCDYISYYKPIKKWVLWKKDNRMMVSFNFCY